MSKYCAKRALSENRELIHEITGILEANPNNIDLTGRRVAPEIFPVEGLKVAAQEVLRIMGAEALQYSSSHDYMPLKEELAARYGDFGVKLEAGNFTITNGSVQAVDMLMKVLVNEGETVLVEEPLPWRVRQAMSMYRPDFRGVPVLADGPDTAVLEQLLKETSPKFFFTTPNYQEPTGVVTSAEKRAEIVRLMKAYDCILVEFDDYSDLGPDEARPAYLMPEMDGQSILIGSITNVVGPGVRIGWVCTTHPVLMKYFTEAKQKTDSHANGLIQRVLWKYIEANPLKEQEAKVRGIYNALRPVAVEAAKVLAPKAEVAPVVGGNWLWVKLPEDTCGICVFKKAAEKGVSVLPGKLFGDDYTGYIYVNYAGSNQAELEKAFAILAEVM